MKKLKLRYVALVAIMLLVSFSTALAEAAPEAPAVVFDLTAIINGLIAILATWLVRYAIPWLRTRTQLWQRQLLVDATYAAVNAAEMIYGSGAGKKKMEYVVNDLYRKGIAVDMSAIEAAVKDLPENMKDELLKIDEQ